VRSWAYQFRWDGSLDELLAALRRAGPWEWSIRDSHWYGDYLNSRPAWGLRVRVHLPATFLRPFPSDEPRDVYLAQLDLESGCTARAEKIDRTFLALLGAAGARAVAAIEIYL
jgi:hypothetical protein